MTGSLHLPRFIFSWLLTPNTTKLSPPVTFYLTPLLKNLARMAPTACLAPVGWAVAQLVVFALCTHRALGSILGPA